MLIYFFTLIVLLTIDRLFIGKLNFFINYIKDIASSSVSILWKMSLSSNYPIKSDSTVIQEESEGKKCFKFVRVRCKNLNTDNKLLQSGILESNMSYEVPSKRSGHRAVCDEENLWIWGGYCPLEHSQTNSNSPMMPEVHQLF
jgi:hypothetical protein